jgi:hypothetical protein
MARKQFQVTVNKDALIRAKADFVYFYGHAMSEWSTVERGLYYWFARMANLKAGPARAIFYGQRGFSARAEMIESLVPYAENVMPLDLDLVKEGVTRARQYSGFRNAIAHGEPIPHITDHPENVSFVMSRPKTPWGPSKSITLEQIEMAAANFAILGRALARAAQKREPTEGLLGLIRALPTEPYVQSAPNSPASDKQPPPDGRVNKKAHRAAKQAAKQKKPSGLD